MASRARSALIGAASWVALWGAGGTMPALAQSAAPDIMQALPDGASDAARAAFEALPEPDRIAIQDALVWTGDYTSTADGSFGRRTFEGIQAWQRRTRRPVSGILDRPSLAALLAAGNTVRLGAGFAILVDPPTGIRIGVPLKRLPRKSANTIGGTRYQSADEKVTLDTRTQPGDGEDLKALYERNLAIQTAGRQITYKLLRPDFFVIAGETTGGRFFSRYAQERETIRGFSIGYDKTMAGEFDRITVAIANSFVPFGGTAPSPGLMAERGQGGGPAPGLAPGIAVPPGMAPPRGGGAIFTGLAIGTKRVLAPAGVQEACREPLVDGAPARIATSARGLALLELAGARRAVPFALASQPAEGAGLVLFFASGEGGRAVVAPADLAQPGRLVAPLQEGASGAVVLDRHGAVAGMVGPVPPARRSVAGLVPPASYAYVGAADLRAVLGSDLTSAPASSEKPMGTLAAALIPALVKITCPTAPPPPPRRP